jgi:UDP-N-acetylglucosamine acyltransferase
VKAAREPLSYAGVNTVGLRRRGFDNEVIAHIEDVYRMIYVHNSNMSRALHAAEMELPNTPTKQIILDFIRESDKGIIRGPQGL